MKIALIQTDIVWCNTEANIDCVNSLIASVEAAELYILPEMWSTGFVIEAQDVAETEEQSKALQWMVDTAAARGCALCGSLVITEGGKYFNRHYFVTPEGIAARYDKHHLFGIGGETKRYTAGQQRVIAEWKGIKFLLQTCYDIRFPVFARNSVVDGQYSYDAIIYVASFPTARMVAWCTLSAARAIENECFVIAVNRTGDDIYCNYNGGSVVWDNFGSSIAEAGNGQSIVMAELDTEQLRLRRRRFPTLIDADLFSIQ